MIPVLRFNPTMFRTLVGRYIWNCAPESGVRFEPGMVDCVDGDYVLYSTVREIIAEKDSEIAWLHAISGLTVPEGDTIQFEELKL